jgi:glycosyltransferase involved in cell wall biosynthesis
MAGLAVALAQRGCDVSYIARQTVSDDRVRQGWSQPSLAGVRLQMMDSDAAAEGLAASAPVDSIHLCGGLRSNGPIRAAQVALARRRVRQWAMIETVDDAGWQGPLKRLEYGRLIRRWRERLEGVLAIGHATPAWLAARGMPADRVFPFAYFLPGGESVERDQREPSAPFRYLFVGRLIELKRLDLLIDCLHGLEGRHFQLAVVGSGPLEAPLRTRAATALPGRVDWVGPLPMPAVPTEMARADCLVLPSRHDGWGAVVSEALMVGTPTICSDACGAAGVVEASGRGGVFERNDRSGLVRLLDRAFSQGHATQTDRMSLAHWAECLAAEAGADYLLRILGHAEGLTERPLPPWLGVTQVGL